MNRRKRSIANRLSILCLLPFLSTTNCANGQQVETQMESKSSDAVHSLWSQWRGPSRDGRISGNSDWPTTLQGGALQQTWRVELGPSYSGPIVSNSFVFTTETVDRQNETVRAFDRKTGKQAWIASWAGAMTVPFFAKANGDWIRSTPAFDGKNLYVAGMRDVLVCLDAKTGKEVWRVDFVEKLGTKIPSFGFVCSPLVTKEHVYVQAGGGLCKLKKTKGEIIWRKLADGGGMNGSAFSSPVFTELAGKKQLLVQTREKLIGVDPESGDVLWSRKIPAFRGMNILTPTTYGESVFTSAYGGNTSLFNVSSGDVSYSIEPRWTNRATGYMSSPVIIDGHAYLHLRNQRFTCIDLESGDSKWTTKPFGKYWSLVANKDQILALDERGELLLIRATPEKFDLIDSVKVSDAPTWAHLCISGEQLFIRELDALTAYRWKSPTEKSDVVK